MSGVGGRRERRRGQRRRGRRGSRHRERHQQSRTAQKSRLLRLSRLRRSNCDQAEIRAAGGRLGLEIPSLGLGSGYQASLRPFTCITLPEPPRARASCTQQTAAVPVLGSCIDKSHKTVLRTMVIRLGKHPDRFHGEERAEVAGRAMEARRPDPPGPPRPPRPSSSSPAACQCRGNAPCPRARSTAVRIAQHCSTSVRGARVQCSGGWS